MSLRRCLSADYTARSILGAVLIAVLFVSTASASRVDTTLICPEPDPIPPHPPLRPVLQPTEIHVRIENDECFPAPAPVDVRLSAMLTSGNQTVANTAIVRPKVVAPNVTVPAANCATFPPTPGVYENDFQAPPVVPGVVRGEGCGARRRGSRR